MKTNQKGLFRGEWITLLLIFAISGITAFFYTRSQLQEKETITAIEALTPTPETDLETPVP